MFGQAMRGAMGMGGGGGAVGSNLAQQMRPQGLGPSPMSQTGMRMGQQMGQRMGQQMQRPGMRMGQQAMQRPMPMPQVPMGQGPMPPPEYRQQGEAAGQDMSWMDQPGALAMGQRNTGIAGNMDQNRMQDMMRRRAMQQGPSGY